MTISYDFFLSAVLEVRVVPLEPTQITLPREGVVMPDVSTALLCGIVSNTTDYVSTWITPNGDRISSPGTSSSTAVGQDGKYGILSTKFGEGFPQESIFTINRLSYLDSGNYTCSIEFKSDMSVHTGSFELTLLGKISMLIIP